jgi:hypothetical protein
MSAVDPRPPFLRPGVRAHLGAGARLMGLALRHLAIALRIALGHLLAGVAAILVVFWEWGWKPLSDLLGLLARLKPFAWLEAGIRRLPPYGALAVFALPSLLLLPLKLASLYLLAQGYKVAAAGLFIGAKVVGTALVARLFLLTKAALMQLAWFKRAYDWLMPLKAALVDWVHDSAVWHAARRLKARAKAIVGPLLLRARVAGAALKAQLMGRLFGRRPGGGERG